MSESPLSEVIKPHKLARKAAKLQGFVPLSALSELSALALNDAGVEPGSVSVDLSFRVSEEGFSVVEGDLAVDLPVRCQRCLGVLSLPLRASAHLLFIDETTRDGKSIDAEPYQERFEGRFEIYPVADEQANLFSLIEQELLLELPIVPVHDHCEALMTTAADDSSAEAASTERENPFSVLGQLKDQLKTSRD